MGSVVLRVIEVKYNDKWQILPYITIKNKHFDYEKDDDIESKKIGEYWQNYVEEASLRIRDGVFGYGTDNELHKRVPDDVSEDVKKIIPENAYCISLDDWEAFINKKEAEFKHHVENLYNLKNFKKINKKLDCLLTNNVYKEEADEDEEADDIAYMEDDVWIEDFYLLIAIHNEYNFIYDTLYAIFENWPQTRIYYWIDY